MGQQIQVSECSSLVIQSVGGSVRIDRASYNGLGNRKPCNGATR